LENPINPYIWCAVGAIVGWLAGVIMKSKGTVMLAENIGVAIFGAFIGGDFLAAMLNKGVINDTVFSFQSLLIAIGGAATALLLLKLMRGSVGQYVNKPKPKHRI
jgi:uncharacterized membrane protein YeaQ/YmgE (transglycosylase-associated protein family)